MIFVDLRYLADLELTYYVLDRTGSIAISPERMIFEARRLGVTSLSDQQLEYFAKSMPKTWQDGWI